MSADELEKQGHRRKKYREPCTFAMYISKKSRRFFKIMKDFKNFARFF